MRAGVGAFLSDEISFVFLREGWKFIARGAEGFGGPLKELSSPYRSLKPYASNDLQK